MNTSSSSTDDPSVASAAPLPAPVHDFIVRVADRGPSTRALAIVSVVGVSLFAVSLLALPRKAAPLIEPAAAAKASVPVSPPAATPYAAVEQPSTPALPTRVMNPSSRAKAFDTAPPAAEIAPAVAAAPRSDAPARLLNAPGVPDTPRGDLTPVGATSRAPIDLIVAPAPPPREREAPAAIVPVISTPREEAPAPRAAVEQRGEAPAAPE